ncbi:MAG: hypothetical protein KF720_15550 [Rubrivivax sp.]|nr:hypothetical protein [Rubrivivax sp.]
MDTPEQTALADLKRIATSLETINQTLLAMLDHLKQRPEPDVWSPKGLFGAAAQQK